MGWLIFNLVGGVLTHYWYNVQCKFFKYVKNKKQEGIVASIVLRARNIPNSNVLWGGYCICRIHQPHTQSMDHSHFII
jgi:hypothetical protein